MGYSYCRNAVLLLCIVGCRALPAQEEPRGSRNAVQTENDLLDSIYTDCLRKDSMSCLKYKLFNFVDKMLGHKDTITVTEGVQIIKTSDGDKSGAPRALNGDESIESLMMGRIQSFLESHTIKVDLKGSEIVNAVTSTARSFNEVVDSFREEEEAEENSIGTEESRGKKKKKGMMGPLMAAAALKAAILGKLALAAIALIAGKALLIGKIALVLSAIIGLKKLLGSGGKHVTYEVVSHPQHSSSHVSSHESVYGGSGGGGGYGGDAGGASYASSGHGGGGGGGWGRSIDAQQLAYRGQPQAASQ